jgi:hypothetical protein
MITTHARRRWCRPLLAALLVGALLTACGDDDDAGGAAGDGDGVASLGTVAPASDDDSATGDAQGDGDQPTEADMQEAALEYARCMREHGIDMPDPQFEGGGGVMIQAGGPGESIDPEQLEAADEACQPIMEKIRGEFEPPDPEQLEQMKEAALEFAQCMREHGIDMPDPQFGEDGRVTQVIGGGRLGEDAEGVDPIDSERFQEASEACGGPGGGFAVSVGGPADGDDDGGAGLAVNVEDVEGGEG